MSNWTSLRMETATCEVPLDWADTAGETIEIFARIVTRPGCENRPYLVFL